MKKYISVLTLLLLLFFTYNFLKSPPAIFLAKIQKTRLNFLIHYEWDVSAAKDGSVTACMKEDDHKLTLYISGSGKMIDFDDNHKIAWNNMKNMTTGWNYKLEKLVIEKDVKSIGYCAFASQSNIEQVVIPSSVLEIGDYAFYNDNSLKNISFSGTIKEWNKVSYKKNTFSGIATEIVHCSDGDKEL